MSIFDIVPKGGQQQDLCTRTSKKTVKTSRVERTSHKLRTASQGSKVRNVIIGRVMIIDTSHRDPIWTTWVLIFFF